MRRLVAICFALLLACGPAAAVQKAKRVEAPRFERTEDVLKWINNYREKPDPSRLPDAVRAMREMGLFRDLDGAGVYVGFIGGVIGADSKTAPDLVARLFPMPPEDQVVLVKAIAFSGLSDWKDLLSSISERMPARKVLIEKYLYGDGAALFAVPLEDNAFALDAHWGYFFATGSPEAVHRIVSTLAWSTDREKVERLTIGAMAKWTLAANASRDKELLDLAKAEMNTAEDGVRAPLREAILAAETFETGKIRKEAVAAIEQLKAKGPQSSQNFAWWGQAGQTALGLGCIAAGVMGHAEVGIPCVVGGALSSAALKYLTP